ncbi:hypothetical protein FRC11_014599, partial [Ceratobasidium sp. 423]
CREPVRGARDSHHTLAVVEAYQSVAPNSSLCQERTADIITALRAQYKPGQTLTIGEGDDGDSGGNGSESSDIEDEDNESYDSEGGTWIYPRRLQ